MALSGFHAFVNPKADGADATVARPSDWNAAHTITGTLPAADVTDLAAVATSGAYADLTGLPALPTSGDFTTAVTAETNTTVSMTAIKWCRVNTDTVVMSGQFTLDPLLTATVTTFEFSLPVASNIGATNDLSGTATCGAIAGMSAEVLGVIANDTAKVRFISSDITSQTWSWVAQYKVI